jgi:hypothetical protein
MVLKEGRKERKKETTKKQSSCCQAFLENCIVTHVVIKLLYLNGNLGFIAVSTKAYRIYINKELSVSSI